MMFFASIGFLWCALHTAPEVDYALGAMRDAWTRHPVYGDPSFDTFERLPCNPVVVGEPPLEWPVNGFLFEDPVGGAWYLYAGKYSQGYAIGAGKGMICTVYRSVDNGASWEALEPIFYDATFRFEGDTHPSNYAPDVSVVYHDGLYHLVYDWLNDAGAWEHLANPPDRDNDNGVGYAWAERPEGPFTRATVPVKRTSEQRLLYGKYRRLYASTLVRREHDWLILTLTDSGPNFAWALLGMTAPTPEGPWSELVPLLHVDQPRYLPPLLEYFPAFQHDGWLYAPATSVALNRNYQALFRARPEEAMNSSAWENVTWGGLWHAEPKPEEQAGIWGQTFSGFVDAQDIFTVVFPSRNPQNRGTLNIARRPWNQPFRERGFVLSGHDGPAIGLLKNAYDAFTLHATVQVTGASTLLWRYTAPLGPNHPRSNATLHPLSLTEHQGLILSQDAWALITVDVTGQSVTHASGILDTTRPFSVRLDRGQNGYVVLTINGEKQGGVELPGGVGAVGLLAHANSVIKVSEYRISGDVMPMASTFLYTEALLGAGQNMAFWREISDTAFCHGIGAISKISNSGEQMECAVVKWNVECSAFKLWAPRHPDYGKAALYLDDALLTTLDFSAAAPEPSAVRYAAPSLPPGRYAVILRVLEGVIPVDCLEITMPTYHPPETNNVP